MRYYYDQLGRAVADRGLGGCAAPQFGAVGTRAPGVGLFTFGPGGGSLPGGIQTFAENAAINSALTQGFNNPAWGWPNQWTNWNPYYNYSYPASQAGCQTVAQPLDPNAWNCMPSAGGWVCCPNGGGYSRWL